MTVFNGDNNQNTNTDNTNNDEGNQSYVKKLVESKGEQWSDPEVIAKGKFEADSYIEELKKQNEELKSQAERAAKLEELVAKIEKKATESTDVNSQSQSQGGANNSETKNPVSEDDLQSLVESVLTKREQESTVKQNLGQVNSQLEQLYGTEADATVQKKAQELGMSMSRLQEIAAESPTAFFSLIGEKPKDFKPMTQGSIRTESVNMQSSNKRNNAFYQELRKKNPREFARAQDQMLKDRMTQGDAFYN